jgi:hypothetical protein
MIAIAGIPVMIRAVLKNGVIQPAEPLPADWADGQELLVDRSPSDDPSEIEHWARELDEGAALIAADDFATFERALAELERQSKDVVRREWGLP